MLSVCVYYLLPVENSRAVRVSAGDLGENLKISSGLDFNKTVNMYCQFQQNTKCLHVGSTMKHFHLLMIFTIMFISSGHVRADYAIFDINGMSKKLAPRRLAGKSNSTYIRNERNGDGKFTVTGNTGTSSRWYIPVNLAISSACKIHFNISSTNVRSFYGKGIIYLIIRTSQEGFQEDAAGRHDHTERALVKQEIPIFQSGGSKDSGIGWLPLNLSKETVFIEGFYVDMGLITCCEGDITVSDLRIVSGGNLFPPQEVEGILATPPPVHAQIKRHDDLGLVLNVNGIEQSGLGYSSGNHVNNSQYGTLVSECNVNITRAIINFGGDSPYFNRHKPVWLHPGYIDFQRIDRLLKKACLGKDTYVIIDLLLHSPPDWWLDKQSTTNTQKPGKQLKSGKDHMIDAVHIADVMNSKRARDLMEFQLSDLDPSWRKYCEDALRQLFTYIRKQPYAKNVIGCHVIFGIGMNDYPFPNRDHHPAYAKAFQEWLRRKHWDVDALRDSWQHKTLTFSSAMPVGQKHWNKGDIFSLIHPVGGGQAADSYAFYQASWADTLLFHCQVIKSLTHGHYITGIVGGPTLIFNSLWNNSYQPTSDSINPILRSNDVDYIEIPVDSMDLRNGNGASGAEAILRDELRQHNKLLFLQNKTPFYTSKGSRKTVTHNREDLIQIQRRIFVAALTNNASIFFVQTSDDEYNQSFAKKEIKQFGIISRKALKMAKKRRSEIAFVIDFDTFKYFAPDSHHSLMTAENSDFYTENNPVIPYLAPQASDYFHLLATPRLLWNRIGAPYDVVSIDHFDPDPYKVVFLYHTLRLTEKRKKIIDDCKNGNRYLISIWANGFVTDRYLSIQGTKRIAGMSLRMLPKRTRFNSNVAPELETFLNRPVKSSSIGWLHVFRERENLHVPLLGPTFHVDDIKATTLANYIDDNRISMALKHHSDWTSVYSASPVIYPEIMREILRKSKVHIYLDSNDLVYINNSFIGIHTLSEGVRQLNLPEESALYEIFTKHELKRYKTHTLKLEGKKTYLFYRGDKTSWDSL